MSKVVVTLAATTVGLGLVCLHLVKQLREGDATIAELKMQVGSLQEQVTAAPTIAPSPAPEIVNPLASLRDAAQPASVEPETPANSARNGRQPVVSPAGAGLARVPPPVTDEDRARMMREARERQRQLM